MFSALVSLFNYLSQQLAQEQNLKNIEEQNLTNLTATRDTNKANIAISDETNKYNLWQTELTNEVNKQIADANLQYQRDFNQQIFDREDSAITRQWKDIQNSGLNPLVALGMSGSGTGGMASAPQSNYIQQAATFDKPTLQAPHFDAYQVSAPQLDPNVFDNIINLKYKQLEEDRDQDTANTNNAYTESKTEEQNIINRQKEEELFNNRIEQLARINKLYKDGGLTEEQTKELLKESERKDEELKLKQKQDKRDAQKTQYQNVKTQAETDKLNEEIDYANQTHEDRVKNLELQNKLLQARNFHEYISIVKDAVETGTKLSSETRAWIESTANRKYKNKLFNFNAKKFMILKGLL